jgi:hypothetical protein
MSNTLKKAELEFKVLRSTMKDAIIVPFEKEILALVDKFGESGQSGGSAPYTAGAISLAVKKLCMQEPICDITGIDSEWNDISEYSIDSESYQNKRLSSVFKEGKSGTPYYLNAIVWKGVEEWDTHTGSVYVNNTEFELLTSRQFINLPFKPKTFYVDVLRVDISKEYAEKNDIHYTEGNDGCYYTILKDETQLDKVFEYYNKETKN